MMMRCDDCSEHYDDFDRWHTCPHERFPVSETALMHLVGVGLMCPRCELATCQCMCEEVSR